MRWLLLMIPTATFAVYPDHTTRAVMPWYAAPGEAAVAAHIAPAQPKPTAAPELLAHQTPREAVAEMRADIAAMLRAGAGLDLPFSQWVWFPDGDEDAMRAFAHAINLVSRSGFNRTPVRVGRHLVRFDLRWYAPTDADLVEWLRLRELLQFDQRFSLLLTRDTIALLTPEQRRTFTFPLRWQVKREGKWVKEVLPTRLEEVEDVQVVRVNAPHLAGSGLEEVQRLTGTQAPIVHHAYALSRMLSTVKDQEGKKNGVFTTIWGGLYYEFAGIRRAKKGVASDLDQLVADLGIGDGRQPFQLVFDRLRSDERAAMFRSGVTGKKRRIIWIGTPAARLSVASGVVFITADIRDRDVDLSQDPIKNLDVFKTAAFEVIWIRANGELGYALFDADGKLLDEAAPDVAADHTVPSPHSPRLQSAISCIRCHGPNDGWIPFENEVQKLLGYQKDGQRLNVFGDVTDVRKTIPDEVDRLVGWYSGSPRKPLSRARDDYAEAVLRATGPWPGSKTGQTDVVRLSSAKIGDAFAYDRYRLIGAVEALQSLGIKPPADAAQAVARLREVLPPIAEVRPDTIVPEDATIGALRAGLKVGPYDYALSYSFMQERAQQSQRKVRP